MDNLSTVLIKSKKLDVSLSKLFCSSEYETAINLAAAIRNFLLFEHDYKRQDAMLALLNIRLRRDYVAKYTHSSHGFGLRIDLPDGKGYVGVHYVTRFSGRVFLLNIEDSYVPVPYWL